MINNRKEKTVLTETRTDRNTFFTVQKYNCYKKMYLLSVLVCFQKVDSYVYNCGFVCGINVEGMWITNKCVTVQRLAGHEKTDGVD